MTSAPTPTVTPRRDGEPTVDLTAYVLVHRAMLRDSARVAAVADAVAGGELSLSAERARALRNYAHELCREIHTHHEGEDRLVWPVVAASAGAAVDLSGLTDDHAVMDPILARAQESADALAAAPADRAAAARLAGAMTEMADLLDEHIGEEEKDLFPIIRQYVSVTDYTALEGKLRRSISLPHLAWVVPWIAYHADADELERTVGAAGWPFRVLLALTRARFTKMRRLALG